MDHWLILLGLGLALTAFALVRFLSQRPQGFWYYTTLSIASVIFMIMTPILIGVTLRVLRWLLKPANYYGGYPQPPLDVQAYLIGLGTVLAVWLWLRVRSANLSRFWKLAAFVEVLALPMIVPLAGEAIIGALSRSGWYVVAILNCNAFYYPTFYRPLGNPDGWPYFYQMWCSWPLMTNLIMILLLLMLMYSIRLMLTRTVRNRTARTESHLFTRDVAGASRKWNVDEGILIADRYKNSPVSKVVGCGLAGFQEALSLFLSKDEAIQFAERRSKRLQAAVILESKTGLASLSSIAISAPLVGAFCSVTYIPSGVFPGYIT